MTKINVCFFELDNGENILTDGKEIYDVSSYNHFCNVFKMNDRLCGVLMKGYTICVVDLKTSEILFEDSEAYSVFKEDERSLCVIKHVVDDFGRSQYRTIIYKSSGEEIIDSYKHRCYPLGNFIQIIRNDESKFLNTLNGNIGDIELALPTKEDDKIDFTKMIDIEKSLRLSDNSKLELPSRYKLKR